MTSVWTRPLTKKFWTVAGLVVLAAFGVVVARPCVVAAAHWTGHRSFIYRGVKIDLPFGWVYDTGAMPITFTKPESIFLNGGVDSQINIERHIASDTPYGAYAPDQVRAIYLKNWTAFFGTSGVQTKDVVHFEVGDGLRTLLCSQQPWTRMNLVEAHCIADDASWSFVYLGSPADLEDAKKIMKIALARDKGQQ